MGSALWNSLKVSEKQPPTNVVNGDIKIVEDIHDGLTTKTVVRADTSPPPGARVKFKPVTARDATENTAKAIGDAPPSSNFDLVGDDISAGPAKRTAGRPRLHPNNADKQRAYRYRKTGV